VYNTPLRMGYRLATWRRLGGIDLTSRSTPGHKRAACFNVAIVHGARASGVSTREADRASNRGFWSDIRIEFYPRVIHGSLNTILGQIQRYEYDDKCRVYSLRPVSKEISGISKRSQEVNKWRAHRQLADDAKEDMRGRGTGDNEAEQNQPCEAVHSTRLDDHLQQTAVPLPATADHGGQGVETLRLSHRELQHADTCQSARGALDKRK